MSSVIIVGTQWGDEGKGKIVDLFTSQADVVVRFQGGNNAGHTLVVDGQKTVLHLIPSGILRPHVQCVIASGMVVDPHSLLEEIAGLKKKGCLKDQAQLSISERAHLIMPYHKAIDQLREAGLKSGKIGTTGRGIGPAYEDKVARRGIRFCDLYDAEKFRERLARIIEQKNTELTAHGAKPLQADTLAKDLLNRFVEIRPFITNTSELINRKIDKGCHVLFEGAQGAHLDVDFGTYPFVTSSNTVAGGALTGAGVGPTKIDHVIGIAKAYTTRVGAGPFPTELHDADGKRMQNKGDEFGATTGRVRRCGWLDLVALKHACLVNGLTGLVMTKLDVLSGFKKIKIAVAYELNGKAIPTLPANHHQLEMVKPVYEEMDGWDEDLAPCKKLSDLPKNTRQFIKKIEKALRIPVILLSLGPARGQDILLRNIFKTK